MVRYSKRAAPWLRPRLQRVPVCALILRRIRLRYPSISAYVFAGTQGHAVFGEYRSGVGGRLSAVACGLEVAVGAGACAVQLELHVLLVQR